MTQLMPLPLTVSCFSKIQIGFTFLVPAHLGSPAQRAVSVYLLPGYDGDLCEYEVNECERSACLNGATSLDLAHDNITLVYLWQVCLIAGVSVYLATAASCVSMK